MYTAHGFHFHEGGSWLKNTLYRTVERWAGGAGTVRIEGSLWNADGPSSMETARWARITAVRGLSASVVPWDRPEPSPADRHEPGNGNGPSNGASP